MCESGLDKRLLAQHALTMLETRVHSPVPPARRQPQLTAASIVLGLCVAAGGCAGTQSFDDGEDELGKTNSTGDTPSPSLPAVDAATTATGPEADSTAPSQPDEPTPPPLPPIAELCDGSDDIRLTYAVGVGFASAGAQSNPTGSHFLVIDGQCNFWLSDTPLDGVHVGSMEPEAARELAEEIQFGRYAALVPTGEPGGCVDGGLEVLVDPTGRLETYCSGVGETEEWQQAFRASWAQLRALASEAPRQWGPTRVLVVALSSTAGLPERLPWNSDFELAAVAVDPTVFPDPSDWTLIDSPTQLDALAQLRETAMTQNRYADSFFVDDDEGNTYELYLSDAPPDAVYTAIQTALKLNR